jgi:hypothetical protein
MHRVPSGHCEGQDAGVTLEASDAPQKLSGPITRRQVRNTIIPHQDVPEFPDVPDLHVLTLSRPDMRLMRKMQSNNESFTP